MGSLTRAAAIYEATMTLRSAGVEGARGDAERLLCHVLQIARTQLIAYSDIHLSQEAREDFKRLVERRAEREPLPYILGVQSFLDFELEVGHAVLIPRPETELLVEVVSNYLYSSCASQSESSPEELTRVIDVATGTGAVAAGLALRHPRLRVLATDISTDALKIARSNIERLNLTHRVQLLAIDLLPFNFPNLEEADLAKEQKQGSSTGWKGHVTAIVSNPPYIPTDEIGNLQPEVSRFEPRLALDGGSDGLRIITRLIHEARDWLVCNGALAFELGAGQSAAALHLLREAGYQECRAYPDLAGIERVVTASWSGG